MKNELDEALVRDFPNLYRDRHASMQVTCMCWGFSCEDGWEPLIRRTSEKLEAEILKLPEDVRSEYKAAQVKQKFGGLRLYMDGWNEAIHTILSESERESFKICEMCGQPGTLRKGGYLQTLCDSCQSNA